jgi:hypothetical protein
MTGRLKMAAYFRRMGENYYPLLSKYPPFFSLYGSNK